MAILVRGKGGDKSNFGSVTGAGTSTNNLATSHKSGNLKKGLTGVGSHGAQLSEDPNFPKRFYEETGKSVMNKDEVKGTMWYDEYFNLEEKIEKMQEDNEKMKREIGRRTERYVKNEHEYREEINELERELRVRKGKEENAKETNIETYEKINKEIEDNIENYDEQLKSLEDEQFKELARKFRSMVNKTKKSIEQEKAKSGDKAAEEAERENELQHHLELITNIAQRTETENRDLSKRNSNLKSKFEKQETDREFMVKQLVLQKKENAKI